MSNQLMRGFRVQLTTAMDSVLRTALFEITKIFETALYDHQMLLAQKGEEVAQLQVKLQKAEQKLAEHECRSPKRVQKMQTQKELKVVSGVPTQSVPDDWCAPLGHETTLKDDDDVVFTGVRLRPFSIQLCHIPIKDEMVSCAIDDRRPEGSRRSRRISAVNKMSGDTPNKTTPNSVQGGLSVRGDRQMLLKQKRKITGKEKENPTIRKKDRRKKTSKSATPAGADGKYSCRFCNKVFNTDFGRRVHVRLHLKCRGCKKIFRFEESLKCHTQSCQKLKNLTVKQTKVNKKPETCDEENVRVSCGTQVIIKEECLETPVHKAKRIPGKYTCTVCSIKFRQKLKLVKHMRVHTNTTCACSFCPRQFRTYTALKGHLKKHRDVTNFPDTNGDLGWTRPLDDIEDN